MAVSSPATRVVFFVATSGKPVPEPPLPPNGVAEPPHDVRENAHKSIKIEPFKAAVGMREKPVMSPDPSHLRLSPRVSHMVGRTGIRPHLW